MKKSKTFHFKRKKQSKTQIIFNEVWIELSDSSELKDFSKFEVYKTVVKLEEEKSTITEKRWNVFIHKFKRDIKNFILKKK
jgi:hypothetical protein